MPETVATMSPTAARSRARTVTRQITVISILVLLLIAAALLRLLVGYPRGWPSGSILDLRMQALVTAAIAGAALSISGVSLQTLLRNSLAEPYILGLATGAALGVFVQAILTTRTGVTFGANHVGALVGALLTMAVVFVASRRHGVIDPLGLLLTGVVIGTINGSIILLLNYSVGPGMVKENILAWMMGQLNERLFMREIAFIAAVTAAGLGLLIGLGRAMDAASFSDGEAMAMGVNLRRLRTVLFVVSSVLAAGAVVLGGPIAFVGLISPHIARLLLGPAHRPLLVGSALIGATLIILASGLSRIIDIQFGTGLIPIGVFTSMLGGPIFLWLLRPQLGKG